MTWSPLHPGGPAGTPESPFPVDIEALAVAQDDLARTGHLIADAAAHLSNLMHASTWESAAATQFAGTAARIHRSLEDTHPRFAAAAAALGAFIDDVDPLIARAEEKVEEARALGTRSASRSAGRSDSGRAPGQERLDSDRERERDEAELSDLRAEFDALVDEAERAAEDAAGRIRAAIDDVVADAWYEELRSVADAYTVTVIAVAVTLAIAALLVGDWAQAAAGLSVAVVLLLTALAPGGESGDRAAVWAGVGPVIDRIGELDAMRLSRPRGRSEHGDGRAEGTPPALDAGLTGAPAPALARLRAGFADGSGALAALRPQLAAGDGTERLRSLLELARSAR